MIWVKFNWWKILAVMLVLFSLIAGLRLQVIEVPILKQSIRNLFFHVPMWFAMIVLLGISALQSLKILNHSTINRDIYAVCFAEVGVLFGLLGIFTGMIWAKNTWGVWWTNDPKLNGALLAMLSYAAYFILRKSIGRLRTRIMVAAVYNVFAFIMLIFFLFILPKIAKYSIHPEQAQGSLVIFSLDYSLRIVFYPAVLGWILLAVWIASIKAKIHQLRFNITTNHKEN